MENEKNTPQPESQLSPEEKLDRMLEKFLEEEAPLPEPESSETEVPQEETDLLADFPMLSAILTDIGPDEEAIADVDLIRPEDLDLEEETEATEEETEVAEEEIEATEEETEVIEEEIEAAEEAIEVTEEEPEATEEEPEVIEEEPEVIEEETEATEEEPEAAEEETEATEEEPEATEEETEATEEETEATEEETEATKEEAKETAEAAPQPMVNAPILPEEPEEPEEEDDEEEEEDLPPKKRRPRNPKAYGFFGLPHIVTTLIWLGIVVFIGVGLGKFIWNCASDVLALGRPDSVVTITISEDDTLETVAQKLKTTGLIRYPSLFKLYGEISDAMDSIRTGTYELNTLYDYHALVDAMSSNQRRVVVNVTIPEGYTTAQIFRLLESYGVTTVAKMENAVIHGELGEYWFLEGVERDSVNCLEGFLFPDTYTFYLDHDPANVLQKFLNNFNKRFNEKMKIKLDTLNLNLSEQMRANGLSEEYIAEHQLTVRDVVIIASMIEKETAANPESYLISSVIYNRLTNPKVYPYLNIDATLVYVLGHGNLTYEDLKYDSPYNTYLYPGLIPGAISNPGSYSLDAALDPTETAYYFYALDPSTGEHHFSQTLKEHQDFLESIRGNETETDPSEETTE